MAKKEKKASTGELCLTLDARVDGPEPIIGAAYLMMDRAYAFIENDKKSLRVTLRPKGARGPAQLDALKQAFVDELAAQKLRWAIARNNREVREYVAENAVALAAEFAARAAAASAAVASDELTVEQRGEIERLIAEVEAEISQMNDKKVPAGAKDASLSWEAAQEIRKGDLSA